MNHKQKLRVTTRLNLQKEKEGKFPIYIRVYVDGKKAEIFSDYWIKESEWNNTKRMVKTKHPKADFINAYLKKVQTSIETNFYELRARNETTTAIILKQNLIGVNITPTHKTILEAFNP